VGSKEVRNRVKLYSSELNECHRFPADEETKRTATAKHSFVFLTEAKGQDENNPAYLSLVTNKKEGSAKKTPPPHRSYIIKGLH